MAIGQRYLQTVQQAINNKRRYCARHSYDFFCQTTSLDTTRPVAWSKILLLLRLMQTTNCKWLFWSDADSLIMNPAIRLEQFIDDNFCFVIGRDMNAINTGQFFIKNCPESAEFLRRIYAREECIHHPWWEQQGFISELADNQALARKTKIVPQRLFNSYCKWVQPKHFTNIEMAYQPGDFLLHFAGVRNRWLLRLLILIIVGNRQEGRNRPSHRRKNERRQREPRAL